jgi:cleavage and polyadenylation specificity factor subunit 1
MHPPTVTRFYFLREHRLHGIVTGMASIKIMASLEDKLDRLLISFQDAKVGGAQYLISRIDAHS